MWKTSGILAVALSMLVLVAGQTPRAAPVVAAGVCGPNPSPPSTTDPAIVVTSPTAGASLPSPIPVTGRARVFEAVVSLSLKDAAGAEIVSGTTMTQAGAPALAPFSTSLAFSVATTTPACLWVFEASARDGSPVNVVQVPLTLLPAGSAAASYTAGWNQVAGPAGMTFPQAVGPLYTFQAGDMAYEMLPNSSGITAGRGYWAFFSAATNVPIAGGGPSSATVAAAAGQWVMVGNPGASMATVHNAAAVVRYDPGSSSYLPVTTLAPGQGAWAFSQSGGTITVGP